MIEALPFSIESFYKHISEKRLMAAKCDKCKSILIPPRPICPHCHSSELKWVQLKGLGKLQTFTIIHVAGQQFQAMIPYIVGIVKLHDGPRLPGILRDIKPEEVKVGMDLMVEFDTTLPSKWPIWPRYFFKPL